MPKLFDGAGGRRPASSPPVSFHALVKDIPCPRTSAHRARPSWKNYKMPGMDGLKVLERLVAAKIGTPVIVISGPVSRSLREQAMKAGARLVLENLFSTKA